jgi:hypothetical protein
VKKSTLTLLSGVILLLVLVATATGVFYHTAGAPIHFVTVRGEHATYQGTGDAFNPLFLVYVTIFALAAVAFFLNLQGMEVSGLPAHFTEHFPRWLFISLTLVISIALTVLWVGGRIIPYTLAGRFPDEDAGMTTLVTQAFDLGMLVPLLLGNRVVGKTTG